MLGSRLMRNSVARGVHTLGTLPLLHFKSTNNYNVGFCRHSTSVCPPLVKKIEELGRQKLEKLKEIKSKYGSVTVGTYTPMSIVGGMRGMTSILTETSQVDAHKGIKFRGYSIQELQELLPTCEHSAELLPEALYWLLLTGEIPTNEEMNIMINELRRKRKDIPLHVYAVLDSLPKDAHPMTQFILAITAMQTSSVFSSMYAQGKLKKNSYWQHILDDSLTLVARLPVVAAYIYRRSFKDGAVIHPDDELDWASNLSKMMGFSSKQHFELMRLYLSLHADHEGGNVSAHACHLAGSALSDPYFSFAAAMAGLAGPLHGLANQECLGWLLSAQKQLNGEEPNEQNVTKIAKDTLQSGQVIPGYGHAVLRTVDPRFSAQQAFAEKHLPDDDLYKLMKICAKVVPEILLATGKVKNPYPNVDCHSGVILRHFNITEHQFYTVLFGVSRSLGVTSQLVWSRFLGLPIERPASITIDNLIALAEKNIKN